MTRVLSWIILTVLTLGGALGVSGYIVGLFFVDDRDLYVSDYGALAAFSMAAFVAGSLAVLALARRLPATTTFPNEWLALGLLAITIGAGFATVWFDRYIYVAPLLAVFAATALFAFVARFVLRWSPDTRVASRGFILPAAWGMIGATLTAIVAQLVIAVMLLTGGVAGLYVADAELMDGLDERISETAELTDLSIIQTPTVAVGALSMLGIVAPLTEELTKFLGVYIVFRRRAATRLNLFLAGAASGLGFAVVETLGYSLMAVEQWPQVMLIRAPVAFIHVAAASIVAVGWYKQRQSGGYWLVGFFALSVLVHAAWNSLFVSMMILAADLDTAEAVSSEVALVTLMVIGAMGAILVATVLWLLGNARTLGREAHQLDRTGRPAAVSTSAAAASPF